MTGPRIDAAERVPTAEIKAERDRFVAFAFCAADVLLELNPRFTVTYAGGATMVLTGRFADELTGISIFDLVPEWQQEVLRSLLERAADGARVENTCIRLSGPHGPTAPMMLVVYHLPDLDGRYFLVLRMGRSARAAIASGETSRDAASGLLDVDAFGEVSEGRLREARARGEGVLMTVIDLVDMESLLARLDAEARTVLSVTLGDLLQANSMGGDSAARFGEDRYGLLHAPDLDAEGLRKQVAHISRDIDPAGSGVSVKRATINVDFEGLSEADAAKALVYTIKRFDRSDDGKLTIEGLADVLSGEMEKAARQLHIARSIIAAATFEIAFQPIVNLGTRRVHHFEALARVTHGGESVAPSEFIPFLEGVGLVADFDMAMCRRVLTGLDHALKAGKDVSVAVNLSSRSLGSVAFMAELLKLIEQNQGLAGNLLFELTESARIADLENMNGILQSLRRAGCRVCLDDFGAGEAAFRYLRLLDVDMVKIDGSYVRQVLTATKDRHFLAAMARLCNDLGIATVAEMIENDQTVDLLRGLGIRFGQGYLFGHPNSDITAFDSSGSECVRAELRTRTGDGAYGCRSVLWSPASARTRR